MPSSLARIYRPNAKNISFLAKRLKSGELVAVPSETVYGLAGNALDNRSCASIFRAKGRPRNDPLIVHIHEMDQLSLLAVPNATALQLARAFWPGALTLVLPRTKVVTDIVSAGRDSVAIRMPRHPTFRRLLRVAGIPLAAPSANPFGYISPTTARHVADNLGTQIKYILDGGPCSIGVESTIVDVRDPLRPRILRPGGITAAQLRSVLRVPLRSARRSFETDEAQLAPGLLSRHYSPRTPVRLRQSIKRYTPANEAFLLMRKPAGVVPRNVYWLDAIGDMQVAARQLFKVLRTIDGQGYRRINVERARGDGLAVAINDRLRRATAKA